MPLSYTEISETFRFSLFSGSVYTDIMQFHAVFTYDPDYQGYVVEVPELPGCFSQGKTVEEATSNIQDAIRGVLHVMARHGEAFVPPAHPPFMNDIHI